MNKLNLILEHGLEPWDLFGTSLFIIGISLGIFGLWLGKTKIKTNKEFNIFIGILTVLFISMEIIHEVGRYLEFGAYDWSSFPFQLCSVSMYIALIVIFLKPGNVKNCFIMFMAIFTTISGLLPLLFGQPNFMRWSSISQVIFSFTWHILLFFMGMFAIGYLNIGKSFKKEYKLFFAAIGIFIGLTCIAQILNFTIHIFANPWPNPIEGFKGVGYLPNYELDPDSASLFYISPYFVSNLPFFYPIIWKKVGWIACWVIYDLCFAFGAFIIYFGIYGLKRLFIKLFTKRQLN